METRRRWETVGRVFVCLWVLFTVPTEYQLLSAGSAANVSVAVGFVIWAAVWIWLWMRALGRNHTAEVIAFVVITVLLSEFALITPLPIGAGGVLVFAFIVAGVILPWPAALWTIAGLSVLQVVLGTIRLEDPAMQISSLLNSILVGGVGIGARAGRPRDEREGRDRRGGRAFAAPDQRHRPQPPLDRDSEAERAQPPGSSAHGRRERLALIPSPRSGGEQATRLGP